MWITKKRAREIEKKLADLETKVQNQPTMEEIKKDLISDLASKLNNDYSN